MVWCVAVDVFYFGLWLIWLATKQLWMYANIAVDWSAICIWCFLNLSHVLNSGISYGHIGSAFIIHIFHGVPMREIIPQYPSLAFVNAADAAHNNPSKSKKRVVPDLFRLIHSILAEYHKIEPDARNYHPIRHGGLNTLRHNSQNSVGIVQFLFHFLKTTPPPISNRPEHIHTNNICWQSSLAKCETAPWSVVAMAVAFPL